MNSRLLLFSLLLFFFSSACTPEPKLELQYDEAVIRAVMQDLYFASSALKNVKTEKADSLKMLYRTQIEQIHKVKLSEVEMDVALLQQHPKYYKKLHAAVQDSIAMLDKRMSDSKD